MADTPCSYTCVPQQRNGSSHLLHVCISEFDPHSCIRTSTISGLAGVTLIISLWHCIVSLHNPRIPKYRLLFFVSAAVEMTLAIVFWVWQDHPSLLVVVQLLKVNQLALVVVFFCAFASRITGRQFLILRVVWPAYATLIIALVGITGFTLATVMTTTGEQSCSTIGWLTISAMGFVLGMAAVVLGVVVSSKLSRSSLSGEANRTRSQLLALVIVCFTAATVQFANDLTVSLLPCSRQRQLGRSWQLGIAFGARVIDTFMPIWAVGVVVARQRPELAGSINGTTEDGERAPLKPTP